MNHPSNQKCANCLYYVHNPQSVAVEGECRHGAPVPLPLMDDGDYPPWGWPPVFADLWCGQWAPTPVQQGEGGAG